MKIVFVSNSLNLHQLYLCEAIKKQCPDFYFVSTKNVQNIDIFKGVIEREYVIKYYNDNGKNIAESKILDADAVIFGDCPNSLISIRNDEKKLSFIYSERFFKKGAWRRCLFTTQKKIKDRIKYNNNENIYVLCASAYLPYDLSFFNFPNKKMLKWGYFPEFRRYDNFQNMIESKKKNSILWAGRLIEWKHPEIPVLSANRLKKEGFVFNIDIVGCGRLEESIKRMIKRYKVDDCVHLCGAMTSEKLREKMESSQIFMFTSDRGEGWGAVLNEAMNSGCAVVSSHSSGSSPFLIENNVNGIIYRCGNKLQLFNIMKDLIINEDKKRYLGENAYKTISEQWNAENAANRLCNIINNIMADKFETYDNGVCSKAEVIKDDWF